MGVKERKIRERKRRANDILEAARRIFESKGFLNTTLNDVAREAEISVGLIYRYFQSKEDIFASLALKGSEQFDEKIAGILKQYASTRRRPEAERVLLEVAEAFFDFYSPYGEYFDMLLYSYKGMKNVQIHGTTLTRLMVVTLSTLDRVKSYIVQSAQFRAKDDEQALGVVFLLWGVLLGCHKLFDKTGRGFLLAFNRADFLRTVVSNVIHGIGLQPHDPSGDAFRPTEENTISLDSP
jgi:AcrR family transcriptional regulator